MEARNVFRKVYNGEKNFMTPIVVGYYVKNNLQIELSTDRQGDLFGVTVIEVLDVGECAKRNDLSKCFKSVTEAKRYIHTL